MRKNKGFTLIELMIVIAIIAIIAAIAIPNLMQNRIRANEASTTSQMRAYVQAQSLFLGRGFGKVSTNTSAFNPTMSAYADNYSNLYYGNPVVAAADGKATVEATANVRLISKAHADAWHTASPGAAKTPLIATGEAAGPNVEFNGYFYGEPTKVTVETFYTERYAHLASPASNRTGSRNFYIDDNGNVLGRLLPAGFDVTSAQAIETPATDPTTLPVWTTN